ncbi:Mannosylglycoprotein endo-beta-mannosidase [Capsicum chinense]|nr:Mannosylglycoprotein endo-beta-mannosidase [Capsicum chinense]
MEYIYKLAPYRIKEDDNVNISFFMYWRRGDPVSNPYGPLDHDLFLLCARDTVKLLRNHPILSLWVGGNEQVPPPDVNAALKNDLQLHPYYMNSNNSGTSAITPVIKDPSRYLDSALLEGYTSDMWSRYTGVLIWKTQNPWTGLRGQFYDHLHDQTAGFYGCPSAAEPIHVQLNLETYSIEVVNTTSEELSNVAIEASVWDLEGECPYNKTSEVMTVTISFEVPPGVTPQVLLYNSSSSCHRLVLDVKMFTLLVLRSEVYHYNCKEVGSKAVALMLSKTVQLCSIGVLHSYIISVHETMLISLPHLAYQYIQSIDRILFFCAMMYYIIGVDAQFSARD